MADQDSDELIKVTNRVPFVVAYPDLSSGLIMYRDIAELVEAIDLGDLHDDPKLLIWELPGDKYAVYPIRCKVVGYSRQQTGSRFTEYFYEDVEGGVRLVARHPISGTIDAILYFNPPELKFNV